MTVLGATSVVVTLFAVGGLAYQLRNSSAASRQLLAETNANSAALFGIVNAVTDVQTTVQKLVRSKDPDLIEKLMEEGTAHVATARSRIREAGGEVGGLSGSLEKLITANARVTSVLLLGEHGQAQQTLIEESNPAYDELLQEIGNSRQRQQDRMNEAAAQMARADSSMQTRILILVFCGLAGLIAFSLALVRRIRGSLERAVSELIQGADQMAGAASQVSSASQSLAQGSSEQASSLEETSATAEQISAMTQKNADSSNSIASVMRDTARMVEQANGRLGEMISSMSEISASGGKISKIIKVIDEIAFQTNILALNAAVEAARAGEAGMGFAVVADEVRSLSQRCAQAANETTALIEESVAKTKEGSGRLDQVAEVISSITEASSRVKALVDEVNQSSQQQSRGMHEIARAISQMEQVTQKTAATAEESAAAGEELTAQSETLRGVVERLNQLVGGSDVGYSTS
jgi:methyl-accepting chemotaxis protein